MPASKKPSVIKVVETPLPDLYPAVRIYDTTLEKIKEKHPEEFAVMEAVYATIQSPDRVHRSKTHPTSVTLINEGTTSAGGDPLRVAVKVVSNVEAIMSTAHFSSASDQGELLWSKGDGDV